MIDMRMLVMARIVIVISSMWSVILDIMCASIPMRRMLMTVASFIPVLMVDVVMRMLALVITRVIVMAMMIYIPNMGIGAIAAMSIMMVMPIATMDVCVPMIMMMMVVVIMAMMTMLNMSVVMAIM